MAIGLVAAASAWGIYLFGLSARCEGRAYYTVDPAYGNCDWHVGWAPPGIEADQSSKCTHPDSQQSYSCAITPGGGVPTANFGEISSTCPAGCSCHSTFAERAARFESCLADSHRHLRCVPFEDDDGSLAAYHSPRKNDARFAGSPMTRRPYLTQTAFLSACEAAMSFAARRSSQGVWLVLATLVPGLVWAAVFYQAACARAGGGGGGGGGDGGGGGGGGGGEGPLPKSRDLTKKAAERADTGIASALAVVGGPLSAALEAANKLSSRFTSDAAELFKFALLSQGVELALQMAALSAAAAVDIRIPLFRAAIIAASAIVTPALYLRSPVDGSRPSLLLFEVVVDLLYAVFSLLDLRDAYFERAPNDGELLAPSALDGASLAIALLSLAYPLSKAALRVRGLAAAKRAAAEVEPLPTRTVLRDPPPKTRSPVYKALLTAYVLGSWATGAVAVAALAGWNCRTFRTCADPGCSGLGTAARPLPFGLLAGGLPFTVPTSTSTYELIMSGIDPTGAQQGFFQWQRSATLTHGMAFTQSGGRFLVEISTSEGSGDATSHVLHFDPSTMASGSQPTPQPIARAHGHAAGTLGTCTARFEVQCQEAQLPHAFRTSRSWSEYVTYSTTAWKLVLDGTPPACWSATNPNDPASSWWFDYGLFNASILHVGDSADGATKAGLVLEESTCADTTTDVDATPDARCINVARGVGGSALYGRRAVDAAPTYTAGGRPPVAEWSTVSLDVEFSVSASLLPADSVAPAPSPSAPGGGDGGGGDGGDGQGNNGAVTLEMSFVLSGDVASYGQAEQDSIKSVLAGEAGVDSNQVTLTLSAASVRFNASIEVDGNQAATIATNMNAGVFSDEALLQTALSNGGVSATVESLTSVTSPVTESPDNPSAAPSSPTSSNEEQVWGCFGPSGCSDYTDSAGCTAEGTGCNYWIDQIWGCFGPPGCDAHTDSAQCTGSCSWVDQPWGCFGSSPCATYPAEDKCLAEGCNSWADQTSGCFGPSPCPSFQDATKCMEEGTGCNQWVD